MPNYYIGRIPILQVLFSEIFHFFWDLSGQKDLSGPGNPTFVRIYVYQHDVRAYAADAVPGDHIVVLSTEKAEIFAGSRHDDGYHLAFRQLDPGIADEPQSPAVADADDLFAVQLRKTIPHRRTPNSFGSVYAQADKQIPRQHNKLEVETPAGTFLPG